MTTRTTRLAPSPTGALHLGNARTFLVNWALGRQNGWRVLLRIEDLDTPRVKPESIEQTRDILRWLGLMWDDEAPLQSTDTGPFREAMRTLAAGGYVYPCELSRTQIAEAAGAPNEGDHETRFPPELRPTDRPGLFDEDRTNWRFVCPAGAVTIDDEFAGPTRVDPSGEVGDFVVWTKRGAPSYQLAVVVDDARQGVTDIVRGDDLLASAARQVLLARALGIGALPRYWHIPLVRGPDGRRLAKRHGDTRLDTYRQRGVAPERVIALLARWSGLDGGDAMSAAEFAEAFRLDRMPVNDVTFTPEDDRWLCD